MSAVEQDLDEFMMGDEPNYEAPPEPPQDADRADMQLRRLAKVRAEIAQVEEDAARQIDRINAWAERRYEVLHGRARWLQAGLEMWHRAVLADDPGRKTISLPCGTLKSRVQQPEWVFDDEVFIAWAVEHAPDLVRVPEPKPAVDKTAAKKTLLTVEVGEGAHSILTEEGEVVPGVTVTGRGPSFSVVTEEVDA